MITNASVRFLCAGQHARRAATHAHGVRLFVQVIVKRNGPANRGDGEFQLFRQRTQSVRVRLAMLAHVIVNRHQGLPVAVMRSDVLTKFDTHWKPQFWVPWSSAARTWLASKISYTHKYAAVSWPTIRRASDSALGFPLVGANGKTAQATHPVSPMGELARMTPGALAKTRAEERRSLRQTAELILTMQFVDHSAMAWPMLHSVL